MSNAGEILFSVTLRHLSADAKKAGADLAEAQLHYISGKQLRSLLDSAAALAPAVVYPAEPELRITGTTGKFVVQVRAAGLQLVSWSSSKQAGGKLTPAQIVAHVMGEDASEGPRAGRPAGGEPRSLRQMLVIGVLALSIVAVNAFTIWFVTRPPKSLMQKFTLLQPGPAERLLTEVAGIYETGSAPGDRRLEIQKNGAAQQIKFGPERAAAQTRTFTVKAAEAAGKPALVTSKRSLITIKDTLSVVLYGDTYQRVPR